MFPSLPKIKEMFKDLKKGSVIYVLDTSDKPKFYKSIVSSVSEPFFPQLQPGQPYPQFQQKLVNIVANVNGINENYQMLPENFEITTANNLTIACSPDLLSKHVESMMRNSSEVLESVDKHKEIVDTCEEILKELSPAYAQVKEQDQKIGNLEKKIGGLEEGMGELKDMLKQALSNQSSKTTPKNEK